MPIACIGKNLFIAGGGEGRQKNLTKKRGEEKGGPKAQHHISRKKVVCFKRARKEAKIQKGYAGGGNKNTEEERNENRGWKLQC